MVKGSNIGPAAEIETQSEENKLDLKMMRFLNHQSGRFRNTARVNLFACHLSVDTILRGLRVLKTLGTAL